MVVDAGDDEGDDQAADEADEDADADGDEELQDGAGDDDVGLDGLDGDDEDDQAGAVVEKRFAFDQGGEAGGRSEAAKGGEDGGGVERIDRDTDAGDIILWPWGPALKPRRSG